MRSMYIFGIYILPKGLYSHTHLCPSGNDVGTISMKFTVMYIFCAKKLKGMYTIFDQSCRLIAFHAACKMQTLHYVYIHTNIMDMCACGV